MTSHVSAFDFHFKQYPPFALWFNRANFEAV